jgi:hypothetical protein
MIKKPMLSLLVLLFALAAVGAGYARWSDTLQVQLDAATGSLAVGVRSLECGYLGQGPCSCQEDVKPQENLEPADVTPPENLKPEDVKLEDESSSETVGSEGVEPIENIKSAVDLKLVDVKPLEDLEPEGVCHPEDVKSPKTLKSEDVRPLQNVKPPVISYSTGPQVCEIKGIAYYEYVDINTHCSCDCCSSRTPFCKLEIGNEGTIPARIKAIRLDWSDKGCSLKKWKAYFPNGKTKSGVGLNSLQKAISASLLEPEQTILLDLQFSHSCSSNTCRIRVDYSLWNQRY